MNKQIIHNRIKLYRISNGVSREDLAKAIRVNVQTIGYIERGDYCPSLELGLKIAKYFELPVEKLFNLEKFKPLDKNS